MTDPSERETIRRQPTPETADQRLAPHDGQVADDAKPGFDPFKFQRITLPPGMRADFIRWSKEAPVESVPEDTLPPNGGIVGSPRPPTFVSKRGLVVGAALLAAAMLVVLAIASRARDHAAPVGTASHVGSNGNDMHAETTRAPAPTRLAAPASSASASGTPSLDLPHPRPPPSKKHALTAKPAEPQGAQRTPERAPEPPKGESALDRPFSTPP